jgi:hypothetical protein
MQNLTSSYLPVYIKLKTAFLIRPPNDKSSKSGIDVGIAAKVEGRKTSGRVRGRPGPLRFADFA